MTVATYAALQAAVSDELRRANDTVFQSRLPRLVAQAEQQIERDLRTRERQATATVNWDAADPSASAPTDFYAAASLTLQTARPTPLAQISAEAYDTTYGALTGLPGEFATWGGLIWLGPSPEQAYAGRLRYWKALPRLADDDAHDAFLAHWDVWFYATMLVSAPGLVDDERVLMWGKLYEGAVAGANQVMIEGLSASARSRRAYGSLS